MFIHLHNNIQNSFHEKSLSLFRGQCYDGAGNMSGPVRGASALITQKNSKAVYTHCKSHRLNLCIVKSCTVKVSGRQSHK